MSGGSVALIGSAAVVATPVERTETPKDATFDAQLEATIGIEENNEARRAEEDAEQIDAEEGSSEEDDESADPTPVFMDVAAVVDRISVEAWDLSLTSGSNGSSEEPIAAEPKGEAVVNEAALAAPKEAPKKIAQETQILEATEAAQPPKPAAVAPTKKFSTANLTAVSGEGAATKTKKKSSSIKPPDVSATDATHVTARMEDLISQAQLPQTVEKPADAAVKPMTRDAMSPQNVSLREATEEGKGAERVRAAEALGHKHVLSSAEAHGHIVDKELGRIEVRARAEDNRIDVQVKAEEARTRQVIAASAVDLQAHVHQEVPNARINIERSISDFTAQNAFTSASDERRNSDGQSSSGSSSRDGNSTQDSSESVIGARIRLKGGRVRFVL